MTMGAREFTKSGAFVAMVFALVVALMPFALEQIGEATGLFEFRVAKMVSNWFSGHKRVNVGGETFKSVDWERYRQDLEKFTEWTEAKSVAVITPPVAPVVIKVEEDYRKPERRIWSVAVTSCTAAEPSGRRKGYVFIAGLDRPRYEGEMIAPSKELCGYEIVAIGERSAWFRVVFEEEGDEPMGVVKLPEFTRIEGETLVRGKRRYVERDAFPLSSGGWLMIDSLLPPDAAVFKILDEKRRVVTTILCVVIGEKGGK